LEIYGPWINKTSFKLFIEIMVRKNLKHNYKIQSATYLCNRNLTMSLREEEQPGY
jgi:hypothetical protein